MNAIGRTWAAFGRLPAPVRLGAVVGAVVTIGTGVLSWDALRWGAGQLGIDPALTWLYPVVADGMIAAATVGAVATRASKARTRVYVWTLLFSGIGISVVGNAAHASGGAELWGPITLHRLGSAVPALSLAATLHLLVIVVRATGPGETVADDNERARAELAEARAWLEESERALAEERTRVAALKRSLAEARADRKAPARRLTERSDTGARHEQVRALLAEPGGLALTGKEIGERLGINEGYARRLRGEVLEAGQEPALAVVQADGADRNTDESTANGAGGSAPSAEEA